MAKKTDGEEKEKYDAHRQIIPVITDEALFLWLEDLFQLSPKDSEPGAPKTEPDSFPERVMLRPDYSKQRGAIEVGVPLKIKEWKPTQSACPTKEQLVVLSNELIATAQVHCNVQQRKHKYVVLAYSGLKGADYYAHYPFTLAPNQRVLGEKGGPPAPLPASDDEDTHQDRFVADLMRHSRWEREHTTEVLSSTLKLQQEMIHDQREWIKQLEAERRQNIVAAEAALSEQQRRNIELEGAKIKFDAIREGIDMVKGLLPAVEIYLTKGKSGAAKVRQFIDGLADEVKVALFGEWENGQHVRAGILSEEQCRLLADIADGKEQPTRIGDFISSLSPQQMTEAQQHLKQSEIQALIALAKAVNDTSSSAA